jgi:hypothetical protein
MAEQRKQGDQTPSVVAESTAASAVSAAPEPSSGAKTKLAVQWPTNQFVVEGVPVVTRDGVAVTAEQRKKVEEAAKKSGVRIREVKG